MICSRLTRSSSPGRCSASKRSLPQMHSEGSSVEDAAATDFGVRREAKRHAAFGARPLSESGVAAPLCHRTPYLCRLCAQLHNYIADGECEADTSGYGAPGEN